MADDPLANSPLDADFRAAHRALRRLAPPNAITAADDDYLPKIVEFLEDLARQARETAAASLGPTISWQGPQPPGDPWESVTFQVDLDGNSEDDPPGICDHVDPWEDSALALASRAYRRECNWDFAPGEAGIWLLDVAPYSIQGGRSRACWSGTLNGFVILHDRDRDGEYESMAHVWTAQAWRRRGIGTSLVRQARDRFPVSRVEYPVTDGGRLLLEACAPDLLERTT